MNKKAIYWSIGGIATAVVGYYAYKKLSSPISFEGVTIKNPSDVETDTSQNTSSNSGSSSSSNSSSATFPLKKGSRGKEVKALQSFLNESNSERLQVDGIFGKLTEGAWKRNQGTISLWKVMYPTAVYGQVSAEFYDAQLR